MSKTSVKKNLKTWSVTSQTKPLHQFLIECKTNTLTILILFYSSLLSDAQVEKVGNLKTKCGN
jgi:hypothetical protein